MCSELTSPPGVTSSSPTLGLFCETRGEPGKYSGDIGDACKGGKRETVDADTVGMVCSDETPDFKGEEVGENEGEGHSGSE